MLFTSKFTRTKAPILFVLAAVIYSALSASPLFQPALASGDESVQIYAGDCVTPQTVFSLGDTVCVRVGEFPLPPDAAEYYRRITYSAPGLSIVETATVRSDPQFDRFRIPDTGDFARPGTWRVHSVDIETNTRSDARFVVRHPLIRLADLNLWKQGPPVVLPGSKVRYKISVRNDGPDLADVVQFTEDVPTNATFLALKQVDGPLFDCRTPGEREKGQIVCGTRGLKPDEAATFDVYYVIDDFAREGDTCEGATLAYSRTEELNKEDNDTVYKAVIGGPDPGEEQPSPEDP
jgi:uncharacterized repeat protein (TIGR01451 family)